MANKDNIMPCPLKSVPLGWCWCYVGVACVDGTCPKALTREYPCEQLPKGFDCDTCHKYKGCQDCMFIRNLE